MIMKNTTNELIIDNGQLTIKEEIPFEVLKNIYLNKIKFSNFKKYPEIDNLYKGWF